MQDQKMKLGRKLLSPLLANSARSGAPGLVVIEIYLNALTAEASSSLTSNTV